MTEFPFDRRTFLKTSGITLTGTTSLTENTAAQETSGGDKIWEFETAGLRTGGGVSSSPTVVDGTVFVGSSDNNDNLYALDAADGSEQWRFAGVGDSSPNVVDNTVFVGGNSVYALDAADGSEQWRFETSDGVGPSPTVVDGTVFTGSNDNSVYALDAADGSEQWRFNTNDTVLSSPTVVDGTVFVGSDDNNVYALDAATGGERWRFGTGGGVASSPTVVNGTAFVVSYDNNVYALDVSDGSEQWRFQAYSRSSFLSILSSPTVLDGTVFVGGDFAYALDADDGSEQWRFEIEDLVVSSPTVANGTVFVAGEDTRVYALDAADGREQWSFGTNERVFSSPTVVDGTVFIGSNDNSVYALDAGVEGSSEDSRINLGTLGHHNVFAEQGPTGPGVSEPSELNAAFSFSPANPTTEDTVRLDASESSDPNGTIQAYEWDIGDDGSFDLTGEIVETKIEEPGEVQITLRVVNDDGLSQTASNTVDVRIPNLQEKLDLIQQIRSVSREEPTEISSREQTKFVPADGGNEVVGFLTKDQSMRFESPAEEFIQELADRGDSVSAERTDKFAEAAKQFKLFERTTKTAAISGIPISARGGEFTSGALLASIPFIGGPIAKSSRFSRPLQSVLQLINQSLGNSLLQDIIESISDTITRLVRRLLGSYSGNDKVENAIQSLNSSFEERFTEDDLESLGLRTLRAVKEAKEENGWEFRPATLFSDGEGVSPLGEEIVQTQLNAASGTDTFGGIVNFLENFERFFGEIFYELFVFDTFESLNDIVGNVADDLETELDNFDLSPIDINTLIQFTNGNRNRTREFTGSALSIYSGIDDILLGIAFLQLAALAVPIIFAIISGLTAFATTGSLPFGASIAGYAALTLGPLISLAEYLGKVYLLIASASAGSVFYVQSIILRGHAEIANQLFQSNRN